MKKTMFGLMCMIVGVFLFHSCVHEVDLYQGTTEEGKKPNPDKVEDLSGFQYSDQFCNFMFYQAKITSNYPYGRFYSVYTEYPYDEDMSISKTPILCGLTPIDCRISVPKGVEKLYVVNDAGLKEYPVGNLNITDATRSDFIPASEFSVLQKYIDNNLLPQAQFSLFAEELYKCTDLVVENIEEDQIVNVWVALVKKNDVPGPVWFYTYTVDNPTIEQVKFYGKDGSEKTFAQIKANEGTCIMNKNTTLNKEIKLPKQFQTGEHIGFVYHGNLGWRFTTPSLNIPANTTQSGTLNILQPDGTRKNLPWPQDDPVGATIHYDSGDFTITQNVFGGAMMHFNLNGKEYNVVGFENRLPGQVIQDNGGVSGFYDGDYNDMLFLVRSDPETIKPEEDLTVPDLTVTTTREGVWLFEDNYPKQGDFDFNDIVIFYTIKQKPNDNSVMEVTCRLAANGCDFSNEIGLKVLQGTSGDAWKKEPKVKVVLWTGIKGYRNVNDAVDLTNLPVKTVGLSCPSFEYLRPYINNGSGDCSLEHYNTGDYPYVLDIPSYGPSNSYDHFLWPKESKSLNDCYDFLPASGSRAADWYKTPKDASLVVSR